MKILKKYNVYSTTKLINQISEFPYSFFWQMIIFYICIRFLSHPDNFHKKIAFAYFCHISLFLSLIFVNQNLQLHNQSCHHLSMNQKAYLENQGDATVASPIMMYARVRWVVEFLNADRVSVTQRLQVFRPIT